jgi:uncharacterized membrane protein YgcG
MFIDDQAGIISSDDAASIRAARSVLDVKILVSSTRTRGELDAHVSAMVNSANTLAIGVDPVHHFAFTHFGVGTGISPADYQMVARAGNGEFHAGHWGEGLKAIVAAANAASVRSESKATVVQPVTVVERPVPMWPFVFGGLTIVVLIAAVVRWMRRQDAKRDVVLNDFRDEASKLTARNLEEQGWHDRFKDGRPMTTTSPSPPPVERSRRAGTTRGRAPAPAPAPAPVVIPQGSNNDGFALGMLMGESMSRPERVVEVVRESPRHESASTSWDLLSSDSSDDGGSGGGSFDGGGGGFDGGGGGGDF